VAKIPKLFFVNDNLKGDLLENYPIFKDFLSDNPDDVLVEIQKIKLSFVNQDGKMFISFNDLDFIIQVFNKFFEKEPEKDNFNQLIKKLSENHEIVCAYKNLCEKCEIKINASRGICTNCGYINKYIKSQFMGNGKRSNLKEAVLKYGVRNENC